MSMGVATSTTPTQSKASFNRKVAFSKNLESLLSEYPRFVLINADHVGSKQLQLIRQSLRGKAEILMGKNTMLRRIIRNNVDKFTYLDGILPYLRGNTGLVFTHMEVYDVRKALVAIKVQRAAKAGSISPVDVVIPGGDTRLEPTKTSFFQALGIASKINKGTINLLSDVPVVKAGQRVTLSQATLLQMLNIKPFHYGLQVGMVYDGGNIYPSSLSDAQESTVMDSIFQGIANVAAISLEIGYPTQASVMYSMRAALGNVLSVAAATGTPLPQQTPSMGTGCTFGRVDEDDDEGGKKDGDDVDDDPIFGLFGDDEEDEGYAAPAPAKEKKPASSSEKTDGGEDDGGDDDGSSMPMGSIFGEEEEW